MSLEDMAYIISTSIAYTEKINFTSQENIMDALNDLRAIKCDELADLVEGLLKEKGALK